MSPSVTAAPSDGRRMIAVIALLCVAAVAAAGLAGGLVSCGPTQSARPTSRPVTATEADLLAVMRLRNYQDSASGLHGVIRAAGGDVYINGWVDWHRPLIYLNSISTTPGPADGLVQAVPGLVALRTGRMTAASPQSGTQAIDPYPAPPVIPPTDGWQVRQLIAGGPSGSAFDTLLSLLFSVSSPTRDNATVLAATGARFVRQDKIGGVGVSVIDGPAVPPSKAPVPGPTPGPSGVDWRSADTGNQVQYWLDASGRLRRMDALLAADLPVEVDFQRDDRTRPLAIDLLGGQPVQARPATSVEAQLLSRMRQRNPTVVGGRIALTLPVNPGGMVRAQGWLNWRTGTIYLAVGNPDNAAQNGLVRADRFGVSTLQSGRWTQQPPLNPPRTGWRSSSWSNRVDDNLTDLEVLLSATLSLTGTGLDRMTTQSSTTNFLRWDTLAGVRVAVFEMRLSPGRRGSIQRRVRCWVDASGVLRRMEVRTLVGAYAHLDVTPGPLPTLPAGPLRGSAAPSPTTRRH